MSVEATSLLTLRCQMDDEDFVAISGDVTPGCIWILIQEYRNRGAIVLDRNKVTKLRDALSAWLATPSPAAPTGGASTPAPSTHPEVEPGQARQEPATPAGDGLHNQQTTGE